MYYCTLTHTLTDGSCVYSGTNARVCVWTGKTRSYGGGEGGGKARWTLGEPVRRGANTGASAERGNTTTTTMARWRNGGGVGHGQ